MPIEAREIATLERPAQYLGGERNSIVKDEAVVDVHFGLAFPDTYEVGMSHVGIQILYDLINQDAAAWAERLYMPLPDMEQWLRGRQQALFSVESQRPLSDFDLLGFSLQYELCGTNILAMLELGGLALYADQRADDAPLLIGGGPYSYHPEPLAPFFDVFFLGDAEEFIPELLACVRESKKACGRRSRSDLLSRLATMEGIYLPSLYQCEYNRDGSPKRIVAAEGAAEIVLRRLLPSMENAPFPKRPVVPNTKTVHNRLSLEVMRGCVRGCRFCQAGYLYRPQRERSPQEIVSLIEEILPQTGYEEVSLLSLSTADYCSVVPLLRSLMDKYGEGDRLAISFPSTRVDALTPEVLEQVQRVRRTGFTIAPEGGSQRLRDVINKGVSDEQILETCSNVFRMGWSGIKLYFMLGLPTETDEDLLAIVDLAARIKALPGADSKDITVSVSTHVPKPHTPFQWAEQITPSETVRRQRLLARGLSKVGVNFRYHDAYSSFLEGIFCRGGRELAPVIERAYRLGARLDAWKEHLSEDIWTEAFASCDINPYFYLRERPLEETLPWEHLSCGIPKGYFEKEYRRALRDKTTADCLTTSCSVCGACNYDTHKNVLWPRHETETWYNGLEQPSDVSDKGEEVLMRLRVLYAKERVFQFLGHLELAGIIQRAARRAALPICYSQGFHPLPRISFGPPLQLGVASSAEFFDLHLSEALDSQTVIDRLNRELPEGLAVLDATEIAVGEPSLSEAISGMRFEVEFVVEPQNAFLAASPESVVDQILATVVEREERKKRKRGRKGRSTRQFPLRTCLSEVVLTEGGFAFTLGIDPQRANPRPLEVVEAVSGLNVTEVEMRKVASIFAVASDHDTPAQGTGLGLPSQTQPSANT